MGLERKQFLRSVLDSASEQPRGAVFRWVKQGGIAVSFQAVKEYFQIAGLGQRVLLLEQSSATVEQAAQALGCAPKQIAKTLSFLVEEQPILIVAAGDAKVDNRKYKEQFHQKAAMIPREAVEDLVGHPPGGVCPFCVLPGVKVYLDVSLKRFEQVYPAAGSGNSAVLLNLPELEEHSGGAGWIDVCKGWEDTAQ